ncbi:MAG TPA: sigma 54-interacting transcriptional regulator [Gammaproteobacteria bacterium]|jgi:PAS domain S-box-containing protein
MAREDRYQWLFRRCPALLAALDKDGYFVDASDAWLDRFGYDRDEIRKLRPQDLASEESAQRISEDYLPLLRRAGHLQDVPVDLRAKSGEIIDCLANVVVERDDSGDYLRTVVIYAEVGASLRAEQHFSGLYRGTPAMLHTVDREGRVVHVNEHWLRKMGYRREEVVGRPIAAFMTAGGHTPDQAEIVDIIAHGELDNAPRSYVTKDGETLEALVSSRVDRDTAGEVTLMYVAIKDVTERNRAERQLRAAFEENARLREELERERDYLREEVQVSMNFGRIIGESPPLKKMLARLDAVAQTSANVLIQGESGVGKELVAHAIHGRSQRANGPLVKVNCASIPRELFESEFFGHVKGAFTGAHRDRIGRFELADGGTLFLDEIGEIPLELQGKLLRVLQESEYERVGDDRTHTVDVRVIAATNRDLEALVRDGGFREDLYYRVSVFPIDVPPLRERGDDVVQLATHFLERVCMDFGRHPLSLSKQQAELLKKYAWPGNVRELKNVIERAVILSSGKVLRLDLAMVDILAAGGDSGASQPAAERPIVMTERELLALQKDNMLAALRFADWRVSGPNGAAKLVGLKPSTFADRMKKFRVRGRRARDA